MKKINNLKIVEKFKYFAPIALALILAGLIVILTLGMNIGIDFAGGAIVKVDLGATLSQDSTAKNEVKELVFKEIENNGFEVSSDRWSGDDGTVLEVGLSLKLDGKKIDLSNTDDLAIFNERIQGSTTDEGNSEGLEELINKAIENYNQSIELDENWFQYDFVGASAQKLLKNALWATAVAVVVMLIYIVIRFTLSSALSAVICLMHDVLVTIALTAIFNIQVNTTFIAAIITIIGYSINATIVIFDRVREVKSLDSMKGKSLNEIANKSIKDTLGRTILTAITTLAVIVILSIVCSVMGVSTMEEFALPIMFGLIAGTYSSVLLASPTWVYLNKLGAKIKKTKKA